MGMRTGADVKPETILTCYLCKAEHTVKEWDDCTYAQCTSRAMRRDYISLTRNKAYKTNTDTLYYCPNCHCWVEGDTFINPPLTEEDYKEYLIKKEMEEMPITTTIPVEDISVTPTVGDIMGTNIDERLTDSDL